MGVFDQYGGNITRMQRELYEQERYARLLNAGLPQSLGLQQQSALSQLEAQQRHAMANPFLTLGIGAIPPGTLLPGDLKEKTLREELQAETDEWLKGCL